jgi:hypothetical protein
VIESESEETVDATKSADVQGVSKKSTHFVFWYFSASMTPMIEMKGICDLPYAC